MLHCLLACFFVAVLAFAGGTFYGHSLTLAVTNAAKKEIADAAAEIKKIRGEIVNLAWRKDS